jgi:hypothetical protein
MIFRYILAAAIKPIRLILWIGSLILSLFFPYVIAIAGTASYVALITYDVSRKKFRRQIDLQYKLEALDYKWRRRAKTLIEKISGAKAMIANAPKEVKRDLSRIEIYFDNIIDDSLKLLSAISNLEKFERTTKSESITSKKEELVKRLENTETKVNSIVGGSLIAISESSQISSVELDSLTEDVESLHSGLEDARNEMEDALDPDRALEKKFEELENNRDK